MRFSQLIFTGIVIGLPALCLAQDLAFEGRVDAGLRSPQRLAVAEDGRMLVSEPLWNRVRLLDAAGTPIVSIGVHRPLAVGFSHDGDLLVGHGGMVDVFTCDGNWLRRLGLGDAEFQSPSDLAVSADGRIYVTDCGSGLVKVYGGTGSFLFQFGQDASFGPLLHPTGIAIDEVHGRVLVGDQGNARIAAFDMNGTPLTTYGRYTEQGTEGWIFEGTFTRIQGLAVDGAGRLFIADSFQNNLQVLDANGQFEAFIQPVVDGSTRFTLPMDVAISGDRLLVAANISSGVVAFHLESSTELPHSQGSAPVAFSLDAAYPNPFNATTTIAFTLVEPAEIKLFVTNLAGQVVAVLAEGNLPAGAHVRSWSALEQGRDCSSGFYACCLQVRSASGTTQTVTQKLLLLK